MNILKDDVNVKVSIHRSVGSDAHDISIMVGELLQEIMDRIGMDVFHFDLKETTERLTDFIEHEKNIVFVAQNIDTNEFVGFVTVYEGYALYAEGAFGTMAELYVRPSYRSKGIGKMLIQTIKEFGNERGWKRIEVTTPPLPQFDATLSFYEREQFEISGGRKLKAVL